jgi:hypothetical protein
MAPMALSLWRTVHFHLVPTSISSLMRRQERKEMEKKGQHAKQQTRKEHIQQRATEKKDRSIAKVSEFVKCALSANSLEPEKLVKN